MICGIIAGMARDELWDAERVGEYLNPDDPLKAASARKEMQRANIRSQHGYPAKLVRAYKRLKRRGRGYRSDLEQ